MRKVVDSALAASALAVSLSLVIVMQGGAAERDPLDNVTIKRLCPQYLDFISRAAEWSKRYGENHLAVVNVRNAAEEVCKSIRDEMLTNRFPFTGPTSPCDATAICSARPVK